MKINDKIGLLGLAIAILFFLFFKLKMNIDYKAVKEKWKSKDIHGKVINKTFHNKKTNEKSYLLVEIYEKKRTVTIDSWIDEDLLSELLINDSLSKKPGTYEIDIYRADTLYKRYFPYKDEK